MTTANTSQPGKRSTWRRKLLYAGGGLIGLLFVGYFVVTSSAFFKGFILPRAGRALGAELTVAEASISPFSQVALRQLAIRTIGTDPLIQVEEVRLRYGLFAILGGNLKVDELTINSPVVHIVENADGTSNLDPLLKNGTAAEPQSQPAPASGQPPQLELNNVALKNATIRLVRNLAGGGREIAELSGINITLDQLQNGQSGKMDTAAVFKYSRPTNDVLEAKSAGHLEFALGADLMPQTLNVRLDQEILRAEGSLSQLAGNRVAFSADITSTEVKEFAQRFFKGSQLLGELKVSGPLDLAKREGRLKLEIASIDRQVLNLVGAPLGIDFGATTLNSTTDLTLAQGGSVITANTRFNAAKFGVTRDGQTTPPLDLQLACSVEVNTTSESALVQTFTLDGTQNDLPLLRGRLAKPMTIAWGKNAGGPGDSALELTVTNFNLAAWKPFVGEAVSAGRLSARIDLLAEQGGKQLKLGVVSQLADLTAKLGDQPLTQAALALKLDGQVNDFAKINLKEYRLDLTQRSQPALMVAGSASYDGAAFQLQTQVEAVLARLTGSGPTAPLTVGVTLDGSFTNQVLDLRQLRTTLKPTSRAPKNELNVTGRVDLSTPGTARGSLMARAETLDLTDLYDAFTSNQNPATKPADTTPAPAPTVDGEPEPMVLPLQLTAEAAIGHLYLREVEIADCQTSVKVDGGKIVLKPLRLSLNGAPVDAEVDLDLGVKGYTYSLSANLNKVPLEPIANTFSPASRGQYQGLILLNARITGAGVTGASLQKNLGGQFAFAFTNANLQLMGPKTKQLLVPIATLLNVNEITKTPLNWLDTQTDLGGGNIKLNHFAVQGAAFDARTKGTIPIAQVLTNSTLNLPVEFALSRSLAAKASLLPPNTPTNAAYAALPQFVTIGGTIGQPKSEVNKLALGGLLLQSGTGIAEKLGVKVDPKVGDALKGVSNLLGGQKSAPAKEGETNAEPKSNPLDLLNKPKK